jgi:hypothetical protein
LKKLNGRNQVQSVDKPKLLTFRFDAFASIAKIDLAVCTLRARPPLMSGSLVEKTTFSVGDYRIVIIFLKGGVNVRFGSLAVIQDSTT